MRLTGLWRHPEFLKLWAGQTISLFGTLIGRLALPFAAVLVLNAGPFEMGLLRAASLIPGFLVGLVAGVWVDRLRRRPILIWTDLGRAALFATIPLAAALDALRIEQLYLVTFLAGVLTVFFEVAYLSYLPVVVRRDQLVEGNSKLQASGSVAEVAGFGIAGALVQLLTAPVAILVDVVSFLASAVSLMLIRTPEPKPADTAESGSVVGEIREGLALVFGNPLLRGIALVAFILNLFQELQGAVYILFVTRELGIDPALQGVLYGLGGVSSLLGALIAGPAAARFGIGPSVVGGLLLGSLGNLCTALAGGPLPLVLALLAAQQLLADGAITVYLINQISLRQAITPHQLQGRMNASIRFLGWTAMLIGAIAGGLLGEAIGLRPTLFVAITGSVLAGLSLLGTPLSRLRHQPPPIPAPRAEAG